jgi:gas vesicle protein
MATGGEMPRKANPLEVIGAWLQVWTPPRDVIIPAVPWRKILIGTGIGAVVLTIALIIMVPRIDHGKDTRAAADRADTARQQAAHRTYVTKEQRAQFASAAALKPAAGASAAQVAAAHAALVKKVEASVMADARARARTGEIRHVDGPTTCTVTPGTASGGARVAYDCFTITVHIKRSAEVPGTIGYPFRAVVNFGDYSYAWCKVEQLPGERLIPDPRTVVQLPKACQIPKH